MARTVRRFVIVLNLTATQCPVAAHQLYVMQATKIVVAKVCYDLMQL